MKADQEKLKQAVIENDAKPEDQRVSNEILGKPFNVTGPRISQIRSGLKVKPSDVSTGQQEAANDSAPSGPEAA